MLKSPPCRYVWGRIRSNRHKTGKASAASLEHLEGRKAQLEQDLAELVAEFPDGQWASIEEDIVGEVELIQAELTKFAAGKRKAPAKVPQTVSTLQHLESYETLFQNIQDIDSIELTDSVPMRYALCVDGILIGETE